MILRLSQKIKTKIKSHSLTEMRLNKNLYADWSSHLFTAGRTQYILLTNTASLYACVMHGRGITNDCVFIHRTFETIRDVMTNAGLQVIYRDYVSASITKISFAKALNRSVTGSMNDHIHAAKLMLAQDVAPSDVGSQLNETPMSALVGPDGRKYGYPKEVFRRQIESSNKA